MNQNVIKTISAKKNGTNNDSLENQLAKEHVGIPIQENSAIERKRVIKLIDNDAALEIDGYEPLPIDKDAPLPDTIKRGKVTKRGYFDFDNLEVSTKTYNGGSIFCLDEVCSQASARAYATQWAKEMLQAKKVEKLPKFNFYVEKKKIGEEYKSGYRIYRVQ